MVQFRYLLRIIILAAIAGATTLSAAGQQTKHPGIDLYNQGKIDLAISSLESAVKEKEFSGNADVWNTLGLAYFAKDDYKRARKAFENAVKISPEMAAFQGNLAFVYLLTQKPKDAREHAERAIQLSPNNTNAHFVLGRIELYDERFEEADAEGVKIIEIAPNKPDGYLLRADALLARLGMMVDAGWDVRDELDLLKQASDILKAGAEKAKADPNHKEVDDQAEAVGAFYRYFAKEPGTGAGAAGGNVVRLSITNKPLPSYTEQARAARVSGKIRVAVLFGADGRVRHTLLLRRLGNGLDEAAVAAAQRIKFVPQVVDGKPVSVVKIVEYSFNVR